MDRNTLSWSFRPVAGLSLSARRAWIEMQVFQRIAKPFRVALRKESVDRNMNRKRRTIILRIVALRKESVDRNLSMGLDGRFKLWSLSARRAWIEILCFAVFSLGAKASLSARRAWIEIVRFTVSLFLPVVALRKESVDRNCVWRA